MSVGSSFLALGALLALSCCNPHLHVAASGIEGVDNVVTQWNVLTQRMVRLFALPNQIAGRVYMEVHVPQYRALQLALKKIPKSAEAAAHYAAHYALSELFPGQQSPIFDGLIASGISELGLSAADDREAERIGVSVAARFLKSRTNDGSQRWAKFQPAPLDGPVGKYQFTPNQTFALYPQLATTRPEVIRGAKDFDTLGGPPSIPSAKYNSDYQTVATVGNANSPLQTKLLKDTARFWEDGGNTSGIVGHLFNMSLAVTGTKISTVETAKLFAKLSVAHFDGAIAGWYQKYKYLFWRPITALRQGESTHAPLPSYDTYLRTPAHPEYPSTHSVNAGAWAAIVSKTLDISMTQKISPFVVATEGYLLPNRTYTSILAPSVEVYLSREAAGSDQYCSDRKDTFQ